MRIRLVLLLLVLGADPAAIAQSPGKFAPTGDMKTPRWVHTATLLTDGKVLIAGGGGPAGDLESAELYDPQTAAFTLTGSMMTARYGQTATLLPDGKVLITGGFAGDGLTTLPLSSAELYDPSHAIFLRTGYMSTGRAFHTATLLGNGKVLIAGGETTDAFGYAPWPQFSLELYDPSTGGFTPTGTTTDCSSPETATLLADGKVFLAANYYPLAPGQIDMAELYDSSTGECSLIAKPPANAKLPTAIALMDGNVLVTADNLDSGPTAGVGFGELYDPISGTLITTKNMTMAREEKSATLLPDGTVLITGGCLCDGTEGIGPFGSAETYDPGKAVFSSTADMHTARHAHTATLLSDGRVLIAGGSGPTVHPGSSDSVLLSSAEVYTPAALIPAPALLSLSGDGKGQGAIQHASTYQLVSPSNPAVAGEALIIYFTGLADGNVIPPQVAIGGRLADLLWFGNTPGFAGLNQVNVRMPRDVASGDAVSVQLNYIGRPSNQVAIAVQ